MFHRVGLKNDSVIPDWFPPQAGFIFKTFPLKKRNNGTII